MSVRRWSILLAFVIVSLVMSLGWVIWLIVAGAGNRIGIVGVLQFLELAIAYGLLRLAEWGHTWGLRWYGIKAGYAGGLAIGILAGGGEQTVVMTVICIFYAAFALFLYFNDEFSD